MWKIFQEFIPLILIILFITQYVIPIIFNRTTWWLFRGKSKNSNNSSLTSELDSTEEEINKVKEKAIDYINSCIKSPCKDSSIIRGYCPDIMFITTHNNIKFNEQLFWMFNNRNIIQIDNRVLDRIIFRYNLDRKHYLNAFKSIYSNYNIEFFTSDFNTYKHCKLI